MADVFISYSRRDEQFVRRLYGALVAEGRDVWVDFEDIPLTADWWREIQTGIEAADVFIFVISPDSARSEVCYKEVDYANQNNKRIVPIVHRDLSSDDQKHLHSAVNRHNWAFFDDEAQFEKNFADLITALGTNLSYVREHTRLLVRATEWSRSERDASYLLRGVDLRNAENLLIESAQYDSPKPTDLQTAYIFASRKGANQRQRLTLGATVVALALMAGLTLLATISFQQAEANLLLSRRTQSLFLADLSRQQLDAQRYRVSLLLALEAVEHFPAVSNGPSNRALLNALTAPANKLIDLLHEIGPVSATKWNRDENRILSVAGDEVLIWDANRGNVILRLQHDGLARGGIWNRDENRILTWSDDGTARVWDPFIENELITLQHDDSVNGATWIENGARIVTWSDDGSVRVWNATSGSPVARFDHSGEVRGVGWHAETRQLMAWAESEISIWTLADSSYESARRVTLRHDDRVQGATWNAAGTQILSWSRDGTARVSEPGSGLILQTLTHERSVSGAVWNVTEDRVLSWTRSDTAHVWNVFDGSSCPLVHEGNVNGATWDQAGVRVLSWSNDRTVRLWNDPCAGDSQVILEHERSADGASWNNDESRILSWGADNTVRVWDAAAQSAGRVLVHGGPVSQAAWSADADNIVSTSLDNTIQIWSLAEGNPGRREVVLDLAHEQRVIGARWNADQTQLFTWSVDGFARLWDLTEESDPQLVWALEHPGPVDDVLLNADESLLATWTNDGTARLWTIDGQPAGVLTHEAEVLGAVWDNVGTRLLTWSRDGTARMWSSDGAELVTMEHPASVTGAAWSPDESQILTWSDNGELRVWNVDGSPFGGVWLHSDAVGGATWSADGTRFLAWSDDGSVRLWDVNNAFLPLLALPHDGPVGGAVWSPDEGRILTWVTSSSDNNVRVWNTERGELLAELPHGNSSFGVQGALWNRNGTRLLAWSSNGVVRVWDIERTFDGEAQPLVNLQHDRFVNGAMWSADESRVLSWSTDDTARIWDVRGGSSGDELFIFRQEDAAVSGAMWNTDERRVLTWNSAGGVKLWVVDVPTLIDIGRTRIVAPLTGAEREVFFLPVTTPTPAVN